MQRFQRQIAALVLVSFAAQLAAPAAAVALDDRAFDTILTGLPILPERANQRFRFSESFTVDKLSRLPLGVFFQIIGGPDYLDINIIPKLAPDKLTRPVGALMPDATVGEALALVWQVNDLKGIQFNDRTIIVVDNTDKKEYGFKTRKIFRLTYIKPKGVMDFLNKTAAIKNMINIANVIPSDDTNSILMIDSERNIAVMEGILELLDNKPNKISARIPLSFLAKADFDKAINDLGDEVKQRVDLKKMTFSDKGRMLIVYDTPDNVEFLRNLVKKIDMAPRQVLIDTSIMTVTSTFTRQIGLKLTSTGFTVDSLDRLLNQQRLNSSLASTSQLPASAQITYLLTKTGAQTLANPKIRTLDNEQASINIGSVIVVRIVSQTQQQAVTGQQNISQNVTPQEINTGVTLSVKPQIHHDRTVTLDLSLTNSSPTQIKDFGVDRDQTDSRTKLRVRDAETIILGGFINRKENIDKSPVPFLGEVPFLRSIFNNNRTDRNNEELVLLLTPYILEYAVDPRTGEAQPARLNIPGENEPETQAAAPAPAGGAASPSAGPGPAPAGGGGAGERPESDRSSAQSSRGVSYIHNIYAKEPHIVIRRRTPAQAAPDQSDVPIESLEGPPPAGASSRSAPAADTPAGASGSAGYGDQGATASAYTSTHSSARALARYGRPEASFAAPPSSGMGAGGAAVGAGAVEEAASAAADGVAGEAYFTRAPAPPLPPLTPEARIAWGSGPRGAAPPPNMRKAAPHAVHAIGERPPPEVLEGIYQSASAPAPGARSSAGALDSRVGSAPDVSTESDALAGARGDGRRGSGRASATARGMSMGDTREDSTSGQPTAAAEGAVAGTAVRTDAASDGSGGGSADTSQIAVTTGSGSADGPTAPRSAAASSAKSSTGHPPSTPPDPLNQFELSVKDAQEWKSGVVAARQGGDQTQMQLYGVMREFSSAVEDSQQWGDKVRSAAPDDAPPGSDATAGNGDGRASDRGTARNSGSPATEAAAAHARHAQASGADRLREFGAKAPLMGRLASSPDFSVDGATGHMATSPLPEEGHALTETPLGADRGDAIAWGGTAGIREPGTPRGVAGRSTRDGAGHDVVAELKTIETRLEGRGARTDLSDPLTAGTSAGSASGSASASHSPVPALAATAAVAQGLGHFTVGAPAQVEDGDETAGNSAVSTSGSGNDSPAGDASRGADQAKDTGSRGRRSHWAEALVAQGAPTAPAQPSTGRTKVGPVSGAQDSAGSASGAHPANEGTRAAAADSGATDTTATAASAGATDHESAAAAASDASAASAVSATSATSDASAAGTAPVSSGAVGPRSGASPAFPSREHASRAQPVTAATPTDREIKSKIRGMLEAMQDHDETPSAHRRASQSVDADGRPAGVSRGSTAQAPAEPGEGDDDSARDGGGNNSGASARENARESSHDNRATDSAPADARATDGPQSSVHSGASDQARASRSIAQLRAAVERSASRGHTASRNARAAASDDRDDARDEDRDDGHEDDRAGNGHNADSSVETRGRARGKHRAGTSTGTGAASAATSGEDEEDDDASTSSHGDSHAALAASAVGAPVSAGSSSQASQAHGASTASDKALIGKLRSLMGELKKPAPQGGAQRLGQARVARDSASDQEADATDDDDAQAAPAADRPASRQRERRTPQASDARSRSAATAVGTADSSDAQATPPGRPRAASPLATPQAAATSTSAASRADADWDNAVNDLSRQLDSGM